MVYVEYVYLPNHMGELVEIIRAPGNRHTVESLKLNISEALAGRTWLLLPEGYRDQQSGDTYPLPTNLRELQKLLVVPIPALKRDSGCAYLKRAQAEFKSRMAGRQSALLDLGRKTNKINEKMSNFTTDVQKMRDQMHEAVAGVRTEATRAIASLSDLFKLGREGLEGQMKAHLRGVSWQGEMIDAAAFRNCFRMVSQTVKAMGLPSDQTDKAKVAIMEEAAAALRDTREALSMAPGTDPKDTVN